MWLLIPILFYTLIYLVVRHIYTYWKRKGFPSEKGNLTWKFLKKAYNREFNHVNALTDIYSSNSCPVFGFYHFFRPTLMIRNLKVARQLLENSNGNFTENKWEFVKGYKRFNILERLAPIFCHARIDGMFRNIEKVADNMVNHLQSSLPNLNTVDMQHICRTYAVNIISNLMYGVDLDLFSETDNVFGNYLQNSLSTYTVSSYTFNRLPKRSSLTYRLRDVLRENVEMREEGSQIRKDVLQLLVKFRNGNDLSSSAKQNWHLENTFVRDKVLSIQVLSVITEAFLNIGFGTIAGAITFTILELLRDPHILQQVLKEIQGLPELQDDKSHLIFANMENLKYLDLCVKETLRKYPAIPYIERVSRKSFNITDFKYSIGTGKAIVIPIMAIQHDEKHFPDPQQYKPSRFTAKGGHEKDAFLSYGLGAGSCIAQNFANMVIKVALVKLFQKFDLSLINADLIDIAFNPSPYIKSKTGLNVKIALKNL